MRKVVFRADASPQIGYGHKTRCHALAEILSEDFECVFPLEEGLPEEDFVSSLEGDEIVVLDNYFYDSAYEQSVLDRGCRLVRFNDFENAASKADILINPSWGMGWSLLREPFRRSAAEGDRPIDFLVCFGGADPLGLTPRYVSYLREKVPGCRVETFSGLDAESLARLMRSARAMVCSASTVCREALACGCRVLAGWYVDNQLDSYRYLVEEGLIVPLGDLREEKISFDPFAGESHRIDMSLVERRYRGIFKALDFDVVAYPDMSPAQSRAAWESRVHPETRRWMTNPEPFGFESHLAFVEKLRLDPSKLYLAFFREGRFVGCYDLVGIEGGKAGHGLFVTPGEEGKGLGSMMEFYSDAIARRMGIRVLAAEVLLDNPRSYGYHLKLGYTLTGSDEKYYYLERRI